MVAVFELVHENDTVHPSEELTVAAVLLGVRTLERSSSSITSGISSTQLTGSRSKAAEKQTVNMDNIFFISVVLLCINSRSHLKVHPGR